jgi:hypothetical protein
MDKINLASPADRRLNSSDEVGDKQPEKAPTDNTSSQSTSTAASTILAPPGPQPQSVAIGSSALTLRPDKASSQRTSSTTPQGARSTSVASATSQPRKGRSSLVGLTQYASVPASRWATTTRESPQQHTQQRQKFLVPPVNRGSRPAHLPASPAPVVERLAPDSRSVLPATTKTAYSNQAYPSSSNSSSEANTGSAVNRIGNMDYHSWASFGHEADHERVMQMYHELGSDQVDRHDMSPQYIYDGALPEYCICHRNNDGGPYIECDNREVCLTRYYHPYCLGMALHLTPDHTVNWFCHNCIREGRGFAGNFKERIKHQHLANRNVLDIDPGFYRDKYGNILRINGLIEARRLSNINTHVANAQAASTQFNIAMNMPSPATVVNPWSADLDKSFMANPQNMIDMDIDTFEGAKQSLRARAAQPLGSPQRVSPRVVNGTVVKQPNKNSWTKEEDDKLVEIVTEVAAMGLAGTPLWDEVSIRMKAAGMSRVVGGARNRWMRGLREATQIDERRKKNALKLTTATQRDKDINKADSDVRGIKRAYDDDNDEYDDDMDMLPDVPTPTRSSLRNPTRQRSSVMSAPRLFGQPDKPAILSSPLRPSRRNAYEVDDYDNALTDVEDLRNDMVRKRLRYN